MTILVGRNTADTNTWRITKNYLMKWEVIFRVQIKVGFQDTFQNVQVTITNHGNGHLLSRLALYQIPEAFLCSVNTSNMLLKTCLFLVTYHFSLQ